MKSLSALFGLVLLSSCVHQIGPVKVNASQSLRLTGTETYAISVVCECRHSGVCTPEVMQDLLDKALRKHGIGQASLKEATRTFTLHCRALPQAPRNEPPLAPGSRLWYQRRIFAPTATRTTGKSSREGALTLEVVIRPNPPTIENVRPKELRAKMTVADAPESNLKTAVEFLFAAIQ